MGRGGIQNDQMILRHHNTIERIHIRGAVNLLHGTVLQETKFFQTPH